MPDGGFFDDYVGEQQGNVTYLPEDYDMSYDGALDQHTGGGLENADTQGELPEGLESVIMITQDMESCCYIAFIKHTTFIYIHYALNIKMS